jgi:hypothetical protein
VRDCFIVPRNASPGQRRWECLNMRMLADPVLGWKGGMRPVIKFSTPGEECLNILKTSDRTWKLDTGWGECKWHVNIP